MKFNSFKNIRIIVTVYVALIVSIAVNIDNFWLALTGVLTGMLFIWLAKRKFQVKTTDEMLNQLAGEAARLSFSITAISLAIVSILLMFFADQAFLKAIGTICSYISLAMIALYSIIYRYFLHRLSK